VKVLVTGGAGYIGGVVTRALVEAVREVTGRPVPVKLSPRRPGDAVASVAASDKDRRDLGWIPARPALHDIIADAWSFTSRPGNPRSTGVFVMVTCCLPRPLSSSDLSSVKSPPQVRFSRFLATGGPT
jgi:UDP-glucose 4-epimerase